jgi:hypothetical protein
VSPDDARLLDVKTAATYLGGVSTATVRGLVTDGVLAPVRMPSSRRAGEQSRRLLFDRHDLDRLIEKWKAASSPAPNVGLSLAALTGWNKKARCAAKR